MADETKGTESTPKQKKTRKPNSKVRIVLTFPRPVHAFLASLATKANLDVETMLEFDAIAKFQDSQKS